MLTKIKMENEEKTMGSEGYGGSSESAPVVPEAPFASAPESVPVKYAGFWIRYVANFIDGIVIGFIIIFPLILFNFISLMLGLLKVDFKIFLTAWVVFVIFLFFLTCFYLVGMTYRYGATLGKKMLNVAVISERSEKLTLKQVVIREILGKFFSGLILGFGFIMAGFFPQKKTLHDKMACTVVIYKDPTRRSKVWLILIVILLNIFFGWLVFSIGLKPGKSNPHANSPIKSVFDKKIISEEDMRKYHPKKGRDEIIINENDFKEIEHKGLRVKYPNGWHISKDGNGLNITPISLESLKVENYLDFLNEYAVITIDVATMQDYNLDRTLEEYIKDIYMLDKNKELPDEIIRKDLNGYKCYRFIDERPSSEFYYKGYDGVEIIYSCETDNHAKFYMNMESSDPLKYEELFELMLKNVKFSNEVSEENSINVGSKALSEASNEEVARFDDSLKVGILFTVENLDRYKQKNGTFKGYNTNELKPFFYNNEKCKSELKLDITPGGDDYILHQPLCSNESKSVCLEGSSREIKIVDTSVVEKTYHCQ